MLPPALQPEVGAGAQGRSATPYLRITGLSKAYGQVSALSDVSIDFFGGEVHAIVGENGAGKSTLTRLIAGEEQPDSGSIIIDGRAAVLTHPADARRAGIAIVHQQFQLVEALTAAENICLEDVPVWRFPAFFPIRDQKAMLARARERLKPFGLAHRAASRIRDLAVAERQVVEICRALGGNARLLILDEPTSALSSTETLTLFRHIRELRARGAAIIFIAHNLAEVLSITDRISVLRDGRLITTARSGTLDTATLAQLIVGRELATAQQPEERAAGDVLLDISRIGGEPFLTLRRGEIIGMPASIGSGLPGLLARISGETGSGPLRLRLRGTDIGNEPIASRVRRGLCLVPGDATAEALAPKLSIADNILLPNARRFTSFGLFRRAQAQEAIAQLIRDFDIRPADPNAPVETLSGGNRQKVAIAKWLLSGAEVLVMDDPARGIDVGAKVEMYRIMRGHVEKQGGILLGSSDLDELIGLADKVMVIRGERVVARFENRPLQKAEILAAASDEAGSRAEEANP
jgi:ABC-type sugar transport system ATPase subunit